MRRFVSDMNPMVRGFVIIAFVAVVIVVLQLQATLVALSLLAQIAFLLAIAFFVYLVWREQRGDIATWSTRARVSFYGAAVLIVVDVAAYWFDRPRGLDALAFLLVLALAAYSMYRIWRDQRTYA
jgi:hypothetical protein